jgi:hypothetical protein
MHKKILMEKMKEAAASVLPVTVIVLAVCLLLVPVESYKRETDRNLWIRSIGTRHSTRYSIVLFTAG